MQVEAHKTGHRLVVALVAAVIALAGLALGSAGVAAADPALTADPTEGLKSGDEVTVNGSGFRPNVELWVMQTVALPRSGMPVAYADRQTITTDGDGDFTATITVQQEFRNVDCAEVKCFITALPNSPRNRTQHASAPLAFAGGAAPAPRRAGMRNPTLSVRPDDELKPNQTVRIGGSQFAPGSKLNVVQTIERPDDGRPAVQTDPIDVTADRAGRFGTQLKVKNKIGDVDCLKVTCFIAAYPDDEVGGNDAWTAIAFDHADNAVLTVDDPVIGQADTAHIRLSGARPGERFKIKAEGPGDLPIQPFTIADDDGNATILAVTDFDQKMGDYKIHFTNEHGGDSHDIGFSVTTSALANPAQEGGVNDGDDGTGTIGTPPVDDSKTGGIKSWATPWVIITTILGAILIGLLAWYARDHDEKDKAEKKLEAADTPGSPTLGEPVEAMATAGAPAASPGAPAPPLVEPVETKPTKPAEPPRPVVEPADATHPKPPPPHGGPVEANPTKPAPPVQTKPAEPPRPVVEPADATRPLPPHGQPLPPLEVRDSPHKTTPVEHPPAPGPRHARPPEPPTEGTP